MKTVNYSFLALSIVVLLLGRFVWQKNMLAPVVLLAAIWLVVSLVFDDSKRNNRSF